MNQPNVEPPRGEVTKPPAGGYGAATVIAGRYKLLEQIGEGGMGTVWVAEQAAPVKRRVALKLIKPGMDSRQVISRFEAERQALALMDHPHIAKVYDGGMTEEGRPYFVMEYVKGIPITDYCDRVRLSIAERLKLLIPVCQAIQHAHQKGIIHRDLKPSNILVCLYDGQAVPKVIDFGLAKAMSQPLTEHTLYTAHGMMVGTPTYMSPEQAEFNNLDIDTRTDIYSLGVILYELLTGSTPLERQRFKDVAWQEVLRLIKDEEPPKPSTRLSSTKNVATIATERSTEPAQLSRLIKGDLDWIVMKALEKERSRRYETPNSLAQDIDRYLRQETVLACPPSTAYRLKKLVQRNRAAVLSVGAVALCLLLGTLVSTFLAIHATRQSRIAQNAKSAAEQERDKATKANEAEQHQRRRAEEQKQLAEEQKRQAESERQKAEQERQRAEVARRAAEAAGKAADDERKQAKLALYRVQALNEELNRQKEQQRRSLYTAQMNLIQKAWDAENITRVRELLNATRPRPGETDLRGFEWHYWQRMSHSDLATLKLAGAGNASTVIFSRDGQQYATVQSVYRPGGNRYEIQVWETSTGKRLLTKELPFDEGSVNRTVGSTYIAAKFFRTYRLCYLDGERVGLITTDRPNYQESPGTSAEVVARMRTARTTVRLDVYRLPSGDEAFALERVAPIYAGYASESFVFSSDGERIISLDSPELAKVWDGRTGSFLQEVPLPMTAYESAVPAVSADGKRLALRGSSLRGPAGATPLVRLPFLGDINFPRFSELGVFPGKETVAVMDVAGDGTTALAMSQVAPASQLQFSPSGARLAGLVEGTGQNSVRIWNAESGEEVCRITDTTTSSSFISRFVFSPDGRWLATLSRHGQQIGNSVRLWDAAYGRPGPEFKGHAHNLTQFAFSSDGSTLISADRTGAVKTWQVPAAKIVSTTPAYMATARSADGNWVAYQRAAFSVFTGVGWPISLEDLTGHSEPRTFGLPSTASFILFAPDAKHLLTANLDPKADVTKAGQVRLWDVASGKEQALIIVPAYESTARRTAISDPLTFPANAVGTAFSPDGRRLALLLTTREENKLQRVIRVWNVADGRELFTTEPVADSSRALRFSPDGQMLVSGSTSSIHPSVLTYLIVGNRSRHLSGTFAGLEVWDAATGKLRRKEPEEVSRVAFSPRGDQVLALAHPTFASGLPTTVYRWDSKTGEELGRISLEFNRAYLGLAMSHDNRSLAVIRSPVGMSSDVVSGPGEVIVLGAETGEQIAMMQGHKGALASVAFSPDGKRIATSAGQASGETKVWDVGTGQEVLSLVGGSAALVFSETSLAPDPAAFANRGGAAQWWDASPIAPQVEAEELMEALLAADIGGRLTPRGELMDHIRKDASIREEVRRSALDLVRTGRRNPIALNEAARAIIKLPSGSQEDYLRAVDYAEEASELSPQEATYLITLGVARYRLGQYSEALATLERTRSLRAANKQPIMAEELLFIAMTHHHLGHPEEARDYFRRGDRATFATADGRKFLEEAATLLGLQSASQFVISGNTARQKGDFDKALADYAEALKLDPQHAPAFANRGDLWNQRQEYDKAIAEFDEAIRLDPSYYWAIANRAASFQRKGHLDQALAGFGKALELSPRYHWALARRGDAWRSKGDFDAALKDYDQAIEINVGTAWYFSGRAHAWRGKGDLEKAINNFDEAIRLDAKYVSAYASRGDLWRQKGDLDKAVRDYDEALRLSPGDAGYYNGRGNVWLAKKDYDRAIRDYDEAIRLNPKNAVYYGNRGRSRRLKGEYAGALSDFGEAVRVDPKHASSYSSRAFLLATCRDEKFRDGKRAVEDATKACELTSWTSAGHLGTLAAAYAEEGDFEKAVQWQVKALELGGTALQSQRESRLPLYQDGKPFRE